MKAGELSSALSAVSTTIRNAEIGVLDELATVLAKHESASAHRSTSHEKVQREIGHTAREAVTILENLRTTVRTLAKKEVAKNLDKLIASLRSLGDTPLASLEIKHVASASSKKRKKGATPVDQIVIDLYLKRLESALGKDDAFMQVFQEFKQDPRVTKQEAVAIADRFNGPVSASTSRPKALQQILSRHRKLMGFETGSASIGGNVI
jgi:hypothetical protein